MWIRTSFIDTLLDLSLADEALDEAYRPKLAQQRRVEPDLVDPVHDLLRRLGHGLPADWVDVHDDDVFRKLRLEQREERRVPRVAAIPVRLDLPSLRIGDLHRLKERRQAGGGQDDVGVDLAPREDADLPRPHVRGPDEEAGPVAGTDAVPAKSVSDPPQRVLVEWPIAVRADRTCHCVHERIGRGVLDRATDRRRSGIEVCQPTCQAHVVERHHLSPKPVQVGPRPLATARDHAGLERRAVHRAGGGARDCGDLQPLFVQQPVEHAPGIGPVGTAPLKRQVDADGPAHGVTAPSSRRRR